MTETTEEKVKRIVMNQEDRKLIEIKDLHYRLSRAEEENKELKFKAKDHTHKVNAVIEAKEKFRQQVEELQSQLSNREEEIEELKKQSNERYVFKEDGFDNYEFVDFLDFKKERAKHIKRFFKWENEVFQAITYGAERWVYYTFDGQDCHFFWNRQEALASLKSKGEA